MAKPAIVLCLVLQNRLSNLHVLGGIALISMETLNSVEGIFPALYTARHNVKSFRPRIAVGLPHKQCLDLLSLKSEG